MKYKIELDITPEEQVELINRLTEGSTQTMTGAVEGFMQASMKHFMDNPAASFWLSNNTTDKR